jgi:tetratricopeptide (TPR) repeat protein
MLMAAQPDLNKAGIQALATHVPEYEAARKRGPQYFPDGVVIDGHRYVMTDGSTQTLAALLPATLGQDKDATAATAVANAYALIALQLGTYYNEMDQNEDAIRVLDQGIALDTMNGVQGAQIPQLIGEKGFALNREKKFDQALAVFQDGSKTVGITPIDRARLERGEGLALTEMGKLDEAEAAYKDSLKDEPGNQRAMNELVYIARLKAGGPTAPVESTLVPPKEEPSPSGLSPQKP